MNYLHFYILYMYSSTQPTKTKVHINIQNYSRSCARLGHIPSLIERFRVYTSHRICQQGAIVVFYDATYSL